MTQRCNVLVFGFGNPGRCDDGLGPAFVERVRASSDAPRAVVIETYSEYQLQVEDADLISRYDVVVFVDASVSCADPFELTTVVPREDHSFTTHSVSPGAVLAMARGYFNADDTQAFVLGIRGHEFDRFEEALSEQAQSNLDAAVTWFEKQIVRPVFDAETFDRAYGEMKDRVGCMHTPQPS
ncbi:MAG: hydrogenase maturation protease [Planctomycetes bacterium]|nr:hydrogenase maturation protease [Planctomycetota bacterium]